MEMSVQIAFIMGLAKTAHLLYTIEVLVHVQRQSKHPSCSMLQRGLSRVSLAIKSLDLCILMPLCLEVEKGVESQPHAKRNRVLAAKCTHGINASNQYIPCHSKSSSIDGNTVENLHSFIVEVKVYILRMEDGLQKLREIITNNTTRHITENFHQNSFTASIDFTVIQAEIVRDILSRSQATNMKESRVSLLSARASCLKALKDSESKVSIVIS